MRLYAICLHQVAVVVVSTAADLPVPDRLKNRPEILASIARTKAIRDSLAPEMLRAVERKEIDDALEEWLGEALRTLRSDGQPMWDGAASSMEIRAATGTEAALWHASRRRAIDAGHLEANDEDWLAFLTPGAPPDRPTHI